MTPYFETDLGKLYHGDCLEIMPELEPVDLVLTDPPYGKTQNAWDDLQTTIKAFDYLSDVDIVFTCQNPSSSILISRYLKRFKWADVWRKSQATGFLNCRVMPLRQHEDIIILSTGTKKYNPQITKKPQKDIRPHRNTAMSANYGKFKNERERTIGIDETYPRSVIDCENSQDGLHPNGKPLKLFMGFVLTYSDPYDIILEPFAGSATTLVSCERLNRRWIGIEISEEYCEIAAKRIEKETQQLKLFN
ncbi:hypothetical protein LCGC14_1394200 [marine sediment metagenome]|uniref:DNA methylase N-4/N-6 domain-containing protein n=1 Tax=marine sediment metagenome TaxID=412755 RepID=A0A0F9KJV6_9ZZZZ